MEDEEVFFIHHTTFSSNNSSYFSLFFASGLCFIVTLDLICSYNFTLQLMDLLFSFLEPNRPHSALLAGYFSKVLSLTIHKFAY